MARYVLSHRRAGKFGEDEHLQSRATLGAALRRMEAEVNVVRDFEPEDPEARRVLILDAEPADIAARMRDLPPDVLLEPEILHWPATNIPIDFIGVRAVPATAVPAAAAATRSVTVQVLGAGSPLAHANVLLFLRGPGGAENKLEGATDASGTDGLTAPYAVMDGTSMASPAVCAVWAGLLAQDATYTQLPRDKTRAQMALAILRQHVSDIGLDARFQGLGLPGL